MRRSSSRCRWCAHRASGRRCSRLAKPDFTAQRPNGICRLLFDRVVLAAQTFADGRWLTVADCPAAAAAKPLAVRVGGRSPTAASDAISRLSAAPLVVVWRLLKSRMRFSLGKRLPAAASASRPVFRFCSKLSVKYGNVLGLSVGRSVLRDLWISIANKEHRGGWFYRCCSRYSSRGVWRSVRFVFFVVSSSKWVTLVYRVSARDEQRVSH